VNRQHSIGLLLCFLLAPASAGWCAEEGPPWKTAGADFSVDTVQPQRGWVSGAEADPGSWQPAGQPDLAERLAAAPPFVWDTKTHELRHRAEPPRGATRPGPIVEALPGLVMGHTVGADDAPILYGFDPASGKVLWTKPVPSPPVTAFSLVRRQLYSFRRGPDGLQTQAFQDAVPAQHAPQDARIP